MYNDTYVPGSYLDLAPSKPFAKDDTNRRLQMEMNGQWMKNKNLPLMRPNATWTWLAHNVKFKSVVVKSHNVLILDTPQKIKLMRDHFPKWLIDNHCIFRASPDLPFKPIDPPTLELPEQARIHKYGKFFRHQRLEQIRKFEMEGGLITHANNKPCPIMGDDEILEHLELDSDSKNLAKIRNLMNEFKDSDTK